MPDQALFVRLCKEAAREMIAGRKDIEGGAAVAFLDEHPDAVPSLVDLIVAEGAKKRPSDKLLGAYVWMLTYGLESIRYRVDRNLPLGEAQADAVRNRILQLSEERSVGPGLLMMLLGQFKQAKLDIGEALQNLMVRVAEQATQVRASGEDVRSVAAHWAEVAEMAEGDAFALHGHLADQAGVLPAEQRALMAASMLDASEDVVREAAVGWLLDEEALVRTSTAASLEQASKSGRVSGTMLRRMIALRNWLPEADRAALDRAIKVCRQQEVVCASWPTAKLEAVIASGLDGSAAQSLFVLTKEGRRFALASLLVKHGTGVRDAFTHKQLTRAEVSAFLDEAADSIDLYPATQVHLTATIRHFLAVSGRAGALPPFGLLDLAETASIADLNPHHLDLEGLVASLCEQMEAKDLAPRGVTRLLKRSARWSEAYPFVDSWFEEDGSIDALLTAEPAPAGEPADVILREYLPERRRYWAEVFAWSALVLRQSGAGTGWEEFAIAARELLGDRDLATIPIMTIIATVSAEVYRHGLSLDRD
jgi:hypothetical protein